MSIYDALEDAVAIIHDSENYGVSGTLKISDSDPGNAVSVIVHMPRNVPYQDLGDRRIGHDGSQWSVHCRKSVKVIHSDRGVTADFALINLLVSEVPTVKPGYTITVGSDVWEVI